ncbi:MAG: type II toxin-antitoxin system HicA family toxin [Planctomycetota bacterium]|nr:MAG: type II toxin-antitoxin system HicA family toxin [Planctomycetota bacterium]
MLAGHGFAEVRRHSHIVMLKADPDGTVTVPVPNHDELKRGTLRSIIRQSGVDKSECGSD